MDLNIEIDDLHCTRRSLGLKYLPYNFIRTLSSTFTSIYAPKN